MSDPDVEMYNRCVNKALIADNKSLRTALAERDWQPIETAPKDGTDVLGWVPSYYQGKGGHERIVWNKGYWWSAGVFQIHPSHWMPLPPPPQEAER